MELYFIYPAALHQTLHVQLKNFQNFLTILEQHIQSTPSSHWIDLKELKQENENSILIKKYSNNNSPTKKKTNHQQYNCRFYNSS